MIAGEEIVVVAEPFLDSSTTTFGYREETQDWVRCYGLGVGESVKADVERMCLLFLHKVIVERPDYMVKLLVDDVERHISDEWVRRHRKPGYEYFYDYLPLNWYSGHKTPPP